MSELTDKELEWSIHEFQMNIQMPAQNLLNKKLVYRVLQSPHKLSGRFCFNQY